MKDIVDIKYKIPDEDKNTVFEKTNKKKWLYANFFIIWLIVLSVFIAFISTIESIGKNYFYLLFFIDLFISIIFLIEYIYRWHHSSQKKVFPFKIINIFDALSFLPFFILLIIKWPWIYGLFVIFRIFRVFRVIELLEKIPITLRIIKWINRHKTELTIWVFILFLVLIIFTSSLYVLEHTWWNKEDFSSLPKTLWWWIYALTTSWDAGMLPVTLLWRLLAWILMVMWPILVSILSSIIILIFLDATSIISLSKKKLKCKNCKTINTLDSNYCKHCSKKL